ncbi:hypothetical protein EDD80_10828 [Anseongella ginsenosidimutans]|uniref:Uncharacterized protein n=1 Tax=Anseongella ginsenosidimutans TaxID=496056 RepID=A0A4R3KQ13_9SPHI|nr:hypothetical protein [Anseongella ginsenosidimutans]QEC53858.1 hypothetical protein FRZ59_17000 [Anseongella ginsenosidimutans]TCS86237.1 hypothetical protein EDD80_10828 [Anseongella ginsenosidimutans]
MLSEGIYIDKTRKLAPALDYEFLRSLGLRYIEELGSKLWTDYNSHDPGVTILEVLCYALTELGYRTAFDIKDLLAAKNGRIDEQQAFFSAKEILSAAPLTVEDYRKLLVDIDGVRNAWLYPFRDEQLQLAGKPSQEVSLFAHCKKDMLTYEKTEHSIELRGLYRVVLDLEESDEFGDLNNGGLVFQFPGEELQGLIFQLLFPAWQEADHVFFQSADPATLANKQVTQLDGGWRVSFELSAGATIKTLEFYVSIPGKQDLSPVEGEVSLQLNDEEQLAAMFSLYQAKLKKIAGILSQAKAVLHGNRNLCEDFLPLETVCTRDIAICADIEVEAGADIEKVYARVLFELENYLDPRVNFYTLKELTDQGLPAQEIFQGPVLTHGFIKTDELKETRPRTVILVSDIINFIMDIEGVLTVKNVLLTKYGADGKPVQAGQRWCLKMDEGCKPVLSVFRSKVLFFKGKLPFRPRLNESLDTLNYLRGLASQDKLKGSADDFPMPMGTFRQAGEYVSVEQEFPMTYGIGNYGLPESAGPERKAQAQQLKAYLRFFDQLLADFFSQLAHAKDLFSLEGSLSQTYFGQYLAQMNGAGEIYRDAASLKQVFQPPAPADPEKVKEARAFLLESPELLYERRNRFLDHLMARFGESFNEYVLMLYAYRNADEYEEIDAQALIEDKIAFLRDYPVISRERGQAFNYREPAWNTANVSGLEKRLARLSGMDDFSRRFLFCLHHIDIQKTEDSPPRYFFNVVDEEGKVLLKSLQEYAAPGEIAGITEELAGLLSNVAAYQSTGAVPGAFAFNLVNESGQALAVSGEVFPDAASRDAAVLEIAAKMGEDCPGEGLHLVEHLLLRPRFSPPELPGEAPEDIYKLFQVCLGENCHFCGEEDPYSFRISIVLPYWHERFKAVEFRDYFETMARTETPAHCMLKICWLNNTLMNAFERAYKEWMEALAALEAGILPDPAGQEGLRLASNKLIDILSGMHSEYPLAQLHDCETGTSNPVLLNNTILGTYIKSNNDE